MTEERLTGDVPLMDARVASRLADVAAERRAAELGKRRRRAIAALVGIGLIAALLGAALSPLMGAHRIEVAGARRTRPIDVVAATRLDGSDPLLRLDERSVTRRVEALPWVKEARLERSWPRAVRITIVEREVKAVAPCAEGSCAVDETGRALAPIVRPGIEIAGAVDPGTVPVLTDVPAAGAPGTALPEASRPALTVALALPETLVPLVRSVRGSATGIELVLVDPTRDRNPPVVLLGDTSRLSEKLTAVTTLLTHLGPAGRVGIDVVNARSPGTPALTRSRPAP